MNFRGRFGVIQEVLIGKFLIMKKIVILLLAVLGFTAGIYAGDNYTRDAGVLPQAARTVIKNNFKGSVSVIKIDKTMGRINDYEVTLTDGTAIKFDRKGNWQEIEVSATNSVPKTFILPTMAQYVKVNQPGTKVVGIERDGSGYEVELSNGVDIKFDKDGNFKKYD